VTHAPTATPAGSPLAGETWTLAPLPPATFSHLLPARLVNEARARGPPAPATPAPPPPPGQTWTPPPLPPATFSHLLPARLVNEARALAPLHVEHLIAWSRESREPPPERLADLIARRGERVAPDARHVLHALAVWGDDASTDVLLRMLPAGVDLDRALRLLDRGHL